MQGQPMAYHSNISAETDNLDLRNTEIDKPASGITVFIARAGGSWNHAEKTSGMTHNKSTLSAIKKSRKC